MVSGSGKRTGIGIDIGTTTISILVLKADSGEVLESRTIQNDTWVRGDMPWEKMQDADRIFERVQKQVSELVSVYAPVAGIGISCQMHGILYTDENGRAVSPFFTWQDERGGQQIPGKVETYAEALTRRLGRRVSAGYGLASHFYNLENGLVPAEARRMATIGDYVGQRLCGGKAESWPMPGRVPEAGCGEISGENAAFGPTSGRSEETGCGEISGMNAAFGPTPGRPAKTGCGRISAGNAASWGGYDFGKKAFDAENLCACGIDVSFLPEIAGDGEIIGYFQETIPVAVAIGDNQASFLGSVPDGDGTVLVNVGTGAQVSVGIACEAENAERLAKGGAELRPCLKNLDLCVGSSLCGGRAYALLEQFFREVCKMACPGRADEAMNGKTVRPGRTNEAMNGQMVCSGQVDETMNRKMACPGRADEALYENMAKAVEGIDPAQAPVIDPAFAGSRSDPFKRASIRGLTTENFTPGYIVYGMLEGIAEELYTLYEGMKTGAPNPKRLIGSGNGIRKNPILRRILEEKFQMPLWIPAHKEEAAYGAALYGLYAAGVFTDIRTGQSRIKFIRAEKKKQEEIRC
ncbi:MAG: FGGY family carbohydrate kinase [Eubacteriales bacterium]|nr:FGGY family carbohydrate kinase [Eubacteriales bacterium]